MNLHKLSVLLPPFLLGAALLALPGCGSSPGGRDAHSAELTASPEPVKPPEPVDPAGTPRSRPPTVVDAEPGAEPSAVLAQGAADVSAGPLPGTVGASEEKTSLPALPAGTKLLHVGDSFAGALGHELNRLLKSYGVHGTLKYEKATYIPTWASNRDFAAHLSRYQPDVVLITLGGNELQIPDPNARAETVRRLVKRVEGRPCVWVGIPLWEGAKPALMKVIRDNVAPCLYLDSTALLPKLARAGDGIHPSTSARTQWAEAVVLWLRSQLAPSANAWTWQTAAD